MELLLNRMKSEYCLARALLYQATGPDESLRWNADAFEGTFTDLLEDEETGLLSEFLRTGFRLCFGVLDRIARGVCNFLEIANETDNIYFHRFWRSGKNDERWTALNQLNNASLVALYGLGRDLSEHSDGEWSHLRKHRNLFEHELCLIRTDIASHELPPWLADSVPSVSLSKMRSDTADMLRFTRAALFYFAFFIRLESQCDRSAPNAPTMTFDKKPIGKT
jgi:hypothetical protein